MVECEGVAGIGEGDRKRADLGLPAALGAGEGDEAFLAKGLLRTDMARGHSELRLVEKPWNNRK